MATNGCKNPKGDVMDTRMPITAPQAIGRWRLLQLVTKRTLMTALAAISLRAALFVPTPAQANGFNSGTLLVEGGTYVCDCTGSGSSCGCVTKN
jgi:hypothetical protein